MEEVKLDPKYEERLKQIEESLERIDKHQTMLREAGGVGPSLSKRGDIEREELLAEKRRILSGLQQRIDTIKETKKTLEILKKKSKSIKEKIALKKEIKDLDNELKGLTK